MKRVVVGLSGGVDSSVAAYLLLQQGYEVIGMFMKNWHDTSVTISDDCPWIDDSEDALQVAEKLGIPFQTIDLSEEYKDRIVDYMFHEYEQGRTPNPDVLCNREIKFDIFLKAAIELGADYVATGHYCRKDTVVQNDKEVHRLLAGKDKNKDQSYFLCQLTQEQLAKALFPIGELEKPEVRAIAKEADLITAEKKDSQGLCFIGKVKLPDFLQQQLKPKSGEIIEIDKDATIYANSLPETIQSKNDLIQLTTPIVHQKTDGKVVGNHNGAHYFTVGQRKGLGVGGTPLPLFIIETNTKENLVFTGQGDKHPGLNRRGLFVPKSDVHWIRTDLEMNEGDQRSYQTRIRYRQQLSNATLYCENEGLYIIFDIPQKGIAKGQFVTWYQDEELIGSGVIS